MLEGRQLTMNTKLILVFSAVIVVTSGVSLAVFMNSSGQDNVVLRYPNSKLVLDTDDDMPHNSNILDKPELTE
jgi:CRISPR/Cas system-associated endonuclease/helicase Cas3